MTREQIESNMIIAKFIGYKYYPHPDKYPGWRKEGSNIVPKKELSNKIGEKVFLGRTARSFQFHSSWDWLMPAVNKFTNQNTRPSEGQDMYTYRQYCNRLYNEITNFQLYSVFYLLVEAIQWDNKNNKK